MSWQVVPNLNEAKEQLDKRFPNRDKSSDGSIGDTAHAARASSHNPDLTGSPEYRDGDTKDEVRARDFDKDLRDVGLRTMEDVVQLWVKKLRAGMMKHVRYIIFNKRIWHRRDNFITHEYTGSNTHEGHAHVNSEFNQEADTVTGTNWYLTELTPKTVTPVSTSTGLLELDGELGPKTIAKWQKVMSTPVDGKISENSRLVERVQDRLRATVDHRLVVDGDGNSFDVNVYRKTVAALQRYLGTPVDGVISTPKSLVIVALQRRLNQNRF